MIIAKNKITLLFMYSVRTGGNDNLSMHPHPDNTRIGLQICIHNKEPSVLLYLMYFELT